jgi:prolyl oligopeptidase
VVVLGSSLIVLALLQSPMGQTTGAARPPAARRVAQVDTLHGIAVADPYRWMEAMTSPEVTTWARAQDQFARGYAAMAPSRDSIRARIAAIASSRRFGIPLRGGSRYYYLDADASFSRRRLIEENSDGARRVLLHEDSLPGGPEARLQLTVPSPDGRWLAWGVSQRGSSWQTIRIRDLTTGRELADTLTGLNGGRTVIAWSPDGAGFYYERLPLPKPGEELSATIRGERLWYHRVGTGQDEDQLGYDPKDGEQFLTTSLSGDGRWLVIAQGLGGSPNNAVLVKDLRAKSAGFTRLVPDADAGYAFLGAVGDTLWFQTTLAAERSRIIAVDMRRPERSAWRTVVAESEDVIDPTIGAAMIGEHLILPYRHDAWMAVKVFHRTGRFAYDLALPKVASIWTGFVGQPLGREAMFVLSDFTDPGTVYRLDVPTGRLAVFRRPTLAHDPDAFVTRQVFFHSKDGTRIPMFLSHRRDLAPSPTTPVLMYGYGAFGWSASPWFRPDVAVWMERGGLFAIPNIRGGGEYGRPWHEAGIRRNKQNAIDDIVAAAEWLIGQGWTSRGRMVINGGSASGMVAGAVVVQRPELFAASTIDYPALDMVRFDRFTGGRQWRPDFGSTDDPEDFRALLAYSPYHGIKPGVCYPATLILPGDKDETTVPMHAYKFAAALQAAQACDRPILLRVSWGAGHSSGATIDDSIDNWADQIAFLERVLDDQPR